MFPWFGVFFIFLCISQTHHHCCKELSHCTEEIWMHVGNGQDFVLKTDISSRLFSTPQRQRVSQDDYFWVWSFAPKKVQTKAPLIITSPKKYVTIWAQHLDGKNVSSEKKGFVEEATLKCKIISHREKTARRIIITLESCKSTVLHTLL